LAKSDDVPGIGAAMAGSENQSRHSSAWLSEGLLLAATPALAYIISFRFEASYLEWYGLPSDLVELSLEHVVFSWTIMLAVVLSLMVFIGNLPARPWHRVLTRVFTVVMVVCAVGIVLLTRSIAVGLPRHVLTVIAIAVGGFGFLWILVESLVPILKHKDLPRWLDRYSREDEAVAAKSPATVLTWAIDTQGMRVLSLWIMSFLFFSGITAGGYLGRLVASLNHHHLVAGGPPECAIIRRYGGHLLCVEIDRATFRVRRSLRLLPVDAMSDEQLQIEFIHLWPPVE
jgi:hypothetical protein